MTLVTYASLFVLLVTVGWSIALLVRLRDARLRALTGLLAAAAMSRIAVLLDPRGSWAVDVSVPIEDLPSLGISMLAVLVLALLDQTLSRTTGKVRMIHDPLTGLPNRIHFIDLLDRVMQRARRQPKVFAVMLLGLDRFHRLNTSHGRSGGDNLLLSLSQRLLGCVRPEDTVARIGGDEFGILLSFGQGGQDAIRVVERIETQLREPFRIGDQNVYATASIGVVSSETPYDSAEELMRDGETAMRRAKLAGGENTYEFFDPAMHQRVLSKLQIEADIRTGLQDNQFRLFYQPLVSFATGSITSFEALVRWEHPVRGMMSPAQFIPIAEESGLIVPLGDWILREACRQAAAWQRAFPRESDLSVSVNLSSRQFQHPHMVENVGNTLISSLERPGSVTLEITESMLMHDIESCILVLEQLRGLGANVHIDDFGTGYSSLSYLHRIPFDALKIDRSFVSGADSAESNRPIVRTIMRLAADLGVEVVAEGVETTEQAGWLKSLGCDYAQGYLYSKPVDADAATRLLETQAEANGNATEWRAAG